MKDTIVALSTANGAGAIAIIRLSGTDAISIADSVFKSVISTKKLVECKTHTVHLGDVIDGHVILDQALFTIFKNPNSYTGENVVEISCHGSVFIQQQVIQLLLKKGARLANAGEFTMRAYLNGKMDLSQAEAVADVIAAETKAEHSLALSQMRGGFAIKLKELRTKLINFAALIELELDFSEEDVEFANRGELEQLIQNITRELTLLIDSFSYGNVIKEGVPVAIAGKPNAGKSSLLNALFKEDKAIVSGIAGTTRDTIEDILVIEGIKFRFIDTAGLREATDEIEKIGIEKAKEKVAQSKVLLYLYDRLDSTPEEIIRDVKQLQHQDLTTLLIENKIDINGGFFKNDFNTQIKDNLFKDGYSSIIIGISTKESIYIDIIKRVLVDEINETANQSNVVVSNSRHLEALENTVEAIQRVKYGLENQITGDFLAQDIRESLYYLGLITGEVEVDKDILGTIFGKFCIGK